MARRMRIGLCVVLALFLGAAGYLLMFPRYLGPSRTEDALLRCINLSQACESYRLNSANTKSEYPRAFSDLLKPSFGGESFLKNGERDLFDPWNERYMLSFDTDANGREFPLVWTVSRNGEFISQFGIGDKARPKRDAQSKK